MASEEELSNEVLLLLFSSELLIFVTLQLTLVGVLMIFEGLLTVFVRVLIGVASKEAFLFLSFLFFLGFFSMYNIEATSLGTNSDNF